MTSWQRPIGRRWLAALAVAILVGGGGWALWHARSTGEPRADHEESVAPPKRLSIVNGEPVITLDPAAQRAADIETSALTPSAYREQLRAYGSVLDLQQLTELSNSYAGASAGRQTALAKLAASKTAFERAQKLYKDQQNVSAADLQAAEAAFRIDEAGVVAAESQLRTITATAQQAWGAPLAHALVERSPIFLRLIERQDVLLQVTLPPGVSVTNVPGDAFVRLANGSSAALTFISPATKTDPRIQGISFFYTAAADTGLLPGMSVLAFLPSDAATDGVVLPPSAVLWWQGNAWVYLKTGEDRFTRHEIATDLPTADGGYMARHLPDGAEVVTRGAQMLLSEEFRAQAQTGERESE